MHLPDRKLQSESFFFLGEDGESEVWSIAMKVKQPGKALLTWTETGSNSKGVISVVRSGPSEKSEQQWQTPSSAYISQVDVRLLGRLVSARAPRELGFYAYYPGKGRITFRTERIEPQPQGRYELFSVPAADLPEQQSLFDGRGNLLKQELASGQVIIPSTPQQISRIWRDRN
jgi:hypothetical protein